MKDIKHAAKDLLNLEALVRKACISAAKDTGIRGESKLRMRAYALAYDTGTFARSIEAEIEALPKEIVLTIGSELDYASYIEQGRKAGSFPNLDALVGWTGRKLKGQGINTRTTVTYDQLKLLAKESSGEKKKAYRKHLAFIYLVGRKIAQKGIKEKRIFRDVLKDLEKFFIDQLTFDLDSVLK